MNKCEICGKECKGKTCCGAHRAKLSRRTRTRTQGEAHAHESARFDEAHATGARTTVTPLPEPNGNVLAINEMRVKLQDDIARVFEMPEPQSHNPMMVGYVPPKE